MNDNFRILDKKAFQRMRDIFFIVLAICFWKLMIMSLLHVSCIMVFFFGIPCPGCGITRAFLAFMQGDFAKAMEMNPSFFVYLLWFFISCVVKLLKCNRKLILKLLLVSGVVSFLIYIERMIRVFPGASPMSIYYHCFLGKIFPPYLTFFKSIS